MRGYWAPVITAAGCALVAQLYAAEPFSNQRERMVEQSVAAEGVTNRLVLETMRHIPRHEFVPHKLRASAYADVALPIGEGQTISPPSLVGLMTQALNPQPGDRVLEIGTGSGYQAAVLSPLVREVYTIEILKPLARRAASTLKRLRYDNVHVLIGDGYKGSPQHAPFDKILVTCSPESVPPALVSQLKEGGHLIIPLGERYTQTLFMFTKHGTRLVADALGPTVFVPMLGEAEAARTRQADPLHPHLVNGSFEELEPATQRPTAWYHQRRLELETAANAPDGRHFVTFRNHVPGSHANASQAFAIDGRKVDTLHLSCFVRAADIQNGPERHEIAALVITFLRGDRSILEEKAVGNWTGTFAWQKWETQVRVPPASSEAILTLGLFGATGTISFDAVAVNPAP